MANISVDDPAVQSYLFYSAILGLKMMALTQLTGFHRFRKNVFPNKEDVAITKGKVKYDDEDVERVRRAHRNDLENIPVFWVLGAMYLTTAPAAAWATLLFRTFAIGRIIHTIVYVVMPMPQPARAFAFAIPYFIAIYMGVQVVLHYI